MLKSAALIKDILKVLTPPPKLTVSEWADGYRMLSSEASAEPGRWRTSRAEYQRGMMDAINEAETQKVVVMTSAQIGKTELLLNCMGYFMDYDPAPIMYVQPTNDMARAFSTDRLDPMLRDTPTLRNKINNNKKRDSGNTIMYKKFPGGHITMAGANSPASLASRPIRILFLDEVDRFPFSAGSEGDPVNLAIKRTTTFWNKKIFMVSTPTVKGQSRIELEYEDSTMEQWQVKCPSCGKYQPYTWAQIDFSDVTMVCAHCKERFDEYTWKKQHGKWVARAENNGTRGFHLNELASPWVKWQDVIDNFLAAKNNPELLQVWVNTSLGESWEEPSDTEADDIIKRRERYNCEVPEGVLLLTAGVDVQNDRLELEVVGWGHGRESWGIEYKVIMGDTEQEPVWTQLDNYLQKTFRFEDGSGILISSVCIDSGGHRTSEVYKFTGNREHRRIFAIKGKGGEGIPFIGNHTRNNRQRAALFTIGVDAGKNNILSRLKTEFEGDGYMHFPIEAEKGYDEIYFDGITSESKKVRKVRGQTEVEWVVRAGSRNEPLDCRNYATAAMEIFGPNFDVLEENLGKNIPGQRPIKRRRMVSKGVI